jgi:hypothetical protein
MEHGLAKVLDFPHQPNHAPYALFTLNPGLQGLLELVGGLLLALGLFTRTVAFILAGDMASPISWRMRREASSRCSTAVIWQSSTVSSFSISGSPMAANGALIDCAPAHPHPPYRRAEPDQSGYMLPFFGLDLLGMARNVAAFNLPARVGQLFGVGL